MNLMFAFVATFGGLLIVSLVSHQLRANRLARRVSARLRTRAGLDRAEFIHYFNLLEVDGVLSGAVHDALTSGLPPGLHIHPDDNLISSYELDGDSFEECLDQILPSAGLSSTDLDRSDRLSDAGVDVTVRDLVLWLQECAV